MSNNPKPISDEQVSLVVRNAIYVIMTLKNELEDELTLLQQYYTETRSLNMPSTMPDEVAFFNTSSALYRTDNLTMSELSKTIAMPMSSTTRIVNWLVDHGYAARLSDPDDRRIVRVTLTGDSRKLYEYIEGRITHRIRDTLQFLTSEEQAAVITVFEKLASTFELHRAK